MNKIDKILEIFVLTVPGQDVGQTRHSVSRLLTSAQTIWSGFCDMYSSNIPSVMSVPNFGTESLANHDCDSDSHHLVRIQSEFVVGPEILILPGPCPR